MLSRHEEQRRGEARLASHSRAGGRHVDELAATKVDQTYAPPFFLMARLGVSSPKKDQLDIGCQLLEKYAELEPKGEYIEEAKRLAGEHCKK